MSTEALKQTITQPTTQPTNVIDKFRLYLEKRKDQMTLALPKHLTADRMMRLSLTEFSKNEKLRQCDPRTIVGAIIQASQLGLEIGVQGQAYLVPYKNNKTQKMEAQMIPGYKGLLSLARRSGELSAIRTEIVYEHDDFDLMLGIKVDIKHRPKTDGDRGKIKLVYGVADFKDGGYHFEWMGIDEVSKIRMRSKAANNGPWVTDYEQMVRKTLIRRMANYLPMSVELQNALDINDAVDAGHTAALDGSFVIVDDYDDVSFDVTDQPNPETVSTETAKTAQDINQTQKRPEAKAGMPDWSEMIEQAQSMEQLNNIQAGMPPKELVRLKDEIGEKMTYLQLP